MTNPRVIITIRSLLGQRINKRNSWISKRVFSSSPFISNNNDLSYLHNVGEQPLKYKTIGKCLEEAAINWPDRPWITSCHEGISYTFSQVLEQADMLAAGLIECGLQPGDRIGIASPNYSKWIISMMAAARAGLIFVPINPVYTESELEFSLKKVGVKCLIIPKEYKDYKYYEMIRNISPELNRNKPGSLNSSRLPNLKLVVILDNHKLPGAYTYDDIQSMANSANMQNVSELQKIIQPDSGCNIQFTSGTTGNPKGALLSHYNFVNNSYLIGKRNELSDKYHKICVQVPLFHAYGIVIVTMASLQHGSTIVLPSPLYSPTESLKSIVNEKCTFITGTPTMYVDLIHKKKSSSIDLVSPEIALIGGSLCSPALFQQAKNVLNVSKMKSVYGMTETSAVVFQSLQTENIQQITDTVGYIQEHTEAKVVDVNGEIVPFGTPGELWIRGYCNMLGYWQDSEKTNEMISPEKWLKTGDQFILQKDGYGKVVGRLKDMIIRGGENVFPKEIENYLSTHPDIVECHVFGVKDERMGEEICASVRSKEGSNFDYDQMKTYCQGKISHFKIPRSPPVLNSYIHSTGVRPLLNSTIGQTLEEAANSWPGKKLIISNYENRTLTFEETLLEADRLASGFLKCGLKPNDRIAICSPNSARYYLTIMAASRIGLILVAINPANQMRELKYCLNKVGVKALVVPSSTKNQNFYNILRDMLPELDQSTPGELDSASVPSLKTIITIDDKKLNGVFTYKDVVTMGNGNEISSLQSSIPSDSSFSILFTSGTTGLPKAVIQSHFSYTNNSMDVGYRMELDKKDHNICIQIPFFHAFGLLIALSSLQFGSTLIIPSPAFSADDAIKTIMKYKCTALTGTPTMYVDMLKKKQEHGILFESPEMAITGGAPCSPQLFNVIKQEFGVSHIRSVYGMTEVCSAFQSMPKEDVYNATETVGRLMDHMEVKVVDEKGNIVPMGTPGELYIRSYSNMTGYWGDDNKTNNVMTSDNWLKTGDQFILEENGYGRISGRLKDIIIRGGENILPKEIEDFLNTHPDVLETQVFGIKDDRLGEEICASVRVKKGSVFDYNQLKIHCKGTIAHFKVPKYLKIVDDFPKTASGKIQKFKLKEMVESGII